jgi:AraC family transcriptional regulator
MTFKLQVEQDSVSAPAVFPETIEAHYRYNSGTQMLIRECKPGAISLGHGHREHVLICRWGRSESLAERRNAEPIYSALRSDGRLYESRHLPVPSVTFIPAQNPFAWEWSFRSNSIHLLLDPKTLEAIDPELFVPNSEDMLLQFYRTDPFVVALMERLRDELAGSGYGSSLATDSVINLLGIHLLRKYCKTPLVKITTPCGLSATRKPLVLDLIEERLTDNIRLEELAAVAGISQFHFARQFKASVGVSPHEYQLRRRIERARNLLLASSEPTQTEIAHSLGFSDESHFRKHFKRIVGVTPGQFRSQSR